MNAVQVLLHCKIIIPNLQQTILLYLFLMPESFWRAVFKYVLKEPVIKPLSKNRKVVQNSLSILLLLSFFLLADLALVKKNIGNPSSQFMSSSTFPYQCTNYISTDMLQMKLFSIPKLAVISLSP